MSTPHHKLYILSATIGITVIAVISQTYVGLPLWIDELHTSWTLLADFDSITERANAGNQSPFYFFLLKLVVSVTGQTETTLRLFSITCACSSVIVLNWLCQRHQLNLSSTLLTTISFAASHLQLLFAVEARSYSLLTLLVLILFCISSTRWSRTHQGDPSMKEKIQWRLEAAWTIVAALCIYTHYMAIPAIGSLWLAQLFISPATLMIRIRISILQALLLGVIIAPQFHALENIYQHRSQWAMFIPSNQATFSALFTKLPVISTLVVPGILLITLRPKLGAEKPLLLGALMLAVVPYLTAWTTTRIDWMNWFFPRYLITCLPALSIFLGVSVAVITRKLKNTYVPMGMALSCLIVFMSFDSKIIEKYPQETIANKNERWDLVAATLRQKAKPDEAILLAAGLVEDTRLSNRAAELHTANITTAEYCTFPLKALYPLGKGLQITPISEYRESSLLANRIRSLSQGWIVVRGERHNKRVKEVLVKMFGYDGFGDHKISGKVNLYSFQKLKQAKSIGSNH